MTFDTVASSNGVTVAPNGSSATVTEAGTYLVMPTVSPVAASQFTVYLNGAPVAGGVLPNNGNTYSGAVTVDAAAGDTVTVVNTAAGAATLADSAGGAPNASLYIQRLGDTA